MKEEILQSFIDDRNPSMSGILIGQCKGESWSNDFIAVAYSDAVGGCGVVGEIKRENRKEAKEFFQKQVFVDLNKMGIDEFEFSTEDEALRTELLDLFSDKAISCEQEYSYRRKERLKLECVIPEGYQIKRVDAHFVESLKKAPIHNTEMLLNRINGSWKDTTDFLEQSMGYVALDEKGIVGVIFGSARFHQYVPVDIEVCGESRNKGLASALTEAFVNQCIDEGWIVQWDHVASNKASYRLAKKCGFHLFKVRPYDWFTI